MLSEIYEQYALYARKPSDELWIPLHMAQEFVASCEQRKIAIIGIDFAHITSDEYLTPTDIWDGQVETMKGTIWDSVFTTCNREAKRALEEELKLDKMQWFNPVLMEESEWS